MVGKVVFSGQTIKEKEIIIRYPVESDLKEMWRYINTLSKERTFVRFQGEAISIAEEARFLTKLLTNIKKDKNVTLEVFHKGKLVGISVAKEYRFEGIGKLLMKHVIAESQANLGDLRIIILSLFSINSLAKKMYEQFGFREYGKLPRGD